MNKKHTHDYVRNGTTSHYSAFDMTKRSSREDCNGWSAQQTPVLGAIAVLKFKSGNCHVAFVIGEDLNSIYVSGGNQDNAVQLSKYAKNPVIAYRYPQGKRKRRPISIIPGSGSDKEDSTR